MTSSLDKDNNEVAAVCVHFYSVMPESVSVVTSWGRAGITSVTMDRKSEADVRLLSVANSGTVLLSHVDMYIMDGDKARGVRSKTDRRIER